MNLVLSGPIDDSLRNLVVSLTRPRRVVRLHDRADRMEGAADEDAVRAEVAALCNAARVDHAYIEEGITFADFKLLAMDMDSTLITIECIDEIADYAGKKAEVSAITEAAMRGELSNFSEGLLLRVARLRGTSVGALRRVYDERLRLSPGAKQLLGAARTTGATTMLLSGGFTYFTNRLAKRLSIDQAHGTVLETANARLTGRVIGPIMDAHAKARYVREMTESSGTAPERAMVIGDGANDILMMDEVKYSVAYHAKPVVEQNARMAVKYGTLKTVLDYFQCQSEL